jgi:predicted O-methyltransferase YrrM
MQEHPEDLVQTLCHHYSPERINLGNLCDSLIPETVTGFHDLSYLFACHQANRGGIAQDFDEAAYTWKVITLKQPARLLEIGCWLGGSTILHAAAAMSYGGILESVDLKVKMPGYADDELIRSHLKRVNLNNVTMSIGDSRTFVPKKQLQYVFIDGDHSYEGVKSDYENVLQYLDIGADVLFHDACQAREFATIHEPVSRFIQEVKGSATVQFEREVGSICHFTVI